MLPEEYERLLAAQNGACAICKLPEKVFGRNGRPKRLSVDHDHETGQIRGLLCSNCNTGLGNLSTIAQCLQAAQYLSRYAKK